MFSLLRSFCKWVVVSLVILALGNWIEWNDQTVSDQIRVQMAHAQRADWYKSFKERWNDWVETGKNWSSKITRQFNEILPSGNQKNTIPSEEILSSESEKLRELLKEFHSPQKTKR